MPLLGVFYLGQFRLGPTPFFYLGQVLLRPGSTWARFYLGHFLMCVRCVCCVGVLCKRGVEAQSGGNPEG